MTAPAAAFLSETTGAVPEHLGRYSFDPAVLDRVRKFAEIVAATVLCGEVDRMSTLDVTADYDTKISVRSRHVRSIFVDR